MSDAVLRDAARLLRGGHPPDLFVDALDERAARALFTACSLRLTCPECGHRWEDHCADREEGHEALGCLVGYGDRADEGPGCLCHRAPPHGFCAHDPGPSEGCERAPVPA